MRTALHDAALFSVSLVLFGLAFASISMNTSCREKFPFVYLLDPWPRTCYVLESLNATAQA